MFKEMSTPPICMTCTPPQNVPLACATLRGGISETRINGMLFDIDTAVKLARTNA